MAPEKVRTTAQDVEVCPPRTTLQIVEFSRGKSKRQRWRTGLLFASAIAVTAAISAALGIAAGLGIAGGSSPSCSDPADTSSDGGEATNVVRERLHAVWAPHHTSVQPEAPCETQAKANLHKCRA